MGKKTVNPVSIYGAQVLLKYLRAMETELEGVITGGDIEYVHRCRVASRRMRSALGLFGDACFSKKDHKTLYAQMRKVTRSLGMARDTDVQIVFLTDVYKQLTDPRLKPGIRRILLRVKQKRIKAQAKVIDAVEYLADKDVIAGTKDKLRPLTNKAQESEQAFDPTLYALANESITSRLDEMLAYEPYIHDPANLEQLHAIRISAKALRYTLESFESIYGTQLKEIIQTMRELQDALGALHDLDVWIDWIPLFIIEERKRVRAYFGYTRPLRRLLPGLEGFLAEQKEKRGLAYG
ncbi:MAG: CHAD domain-containing protein, partial [Anaerolineaceae bacterium]|nr:CHAD domain-containing protein [Anaerolineaceae bacterium]